MSGRNLGLTTIAGLTLLAVLALLLGLGVIFPVAPFAGKPTLDHRVRSVGEQLRCVVCEGQSVAESASTVAVQQRQEIREMLAQGMSEEEVIEVFRQRYGDWILLSPPAKGPVLLAWLLPFAMAAAGLYLLSLFLRRSRGEPAPAEQEGSAAEHGDPEDSPETGATAGSTAGDMPEPEDLRDYL